MNLILGLTLSLIVFVLANLLYRVLNRPKVRPIDLAERPNAALLVIDMQEDFTRMTGKMAHDAEKRDRAIEHINQLANEARANGIPVIEISHAFTDPLEKIVVKLISGGAGIEGSPGLKRDEALTFEANYHVWKHEGDSFTAPMFERFLDDHKIGHLYLTGQDANACVNSTARGALKRRYAVTMLDAGILARNEGKWQKKRQLLIAAGANSDETFQNFVSASGN